MNYYNRQGYKLTPDSFKKPLKDAFGKTMNQLKIDPLWIHWATPCLEPRPDDPDVYLKQFKANNISTLAKFIEVFGKKS